MLGVLLISLLHFGVPSMYRIRAANTIPIGGNAIEYEKSKCINGVVDQLRYSS